MCSLPVTMKRDSGSFPLLVALHSLKRAHLVSILFFPVSFAFALLSLSGQDMWA